MSAETARARELAAVLSRHGMGYLVGRIDRRSTPTTAPAHVRAALEEMGVTFVKLGQLLSTRQDLLPPEYRAELARLQDAVPGLPGELVHAVVEEELGRPVEEAFATFDPAPLAAASIGQAHAATLPGGAEVVVKVRRPGVVDDVARDLEILSNLAARAVRHSRAAAEWDAVGVAGEFARTLRAELDYLAEGRNAERFAAAFAGDPDVLIPRVHWETTTSRVLTLDRVRGIKVDDLAALDAAGIDRRALAARATRVTALMIFRDGFLHGDPHPGNLLIQDDGRIGLIDFGMVGTIDDRLRDRLADVMIGYAQHDADVLTDALLDLAANGRSVDRTALRADLATMLDRYTGVGIGEVPLGEAIERLLEVLRRHRLRLPSDLSLLLKVLIMDQGMAAALDPGFRLQEALAPHAQRLIERRLEPDALAERFRRAGADAARLGAEAPAQLRSILRSVERGDLGVRVAGDELERLLRSAERTGDRLVAAILAAALVQAAAQLAAGRPTRRRRPAIAALGAAALVAGMAASRRPRRT